MKEKEPRGETFQAALYKVGINRCVDVPEVVSVVLGGGKYLPVRGWVGGLEFRSTLVPRGGGAHRLFLHSEIWRTLRAEVGDSVGVCLEKDEDPREVEVPEDLAKLLPEGSEARAAFEALTLADRRRFIGRIEEARKAETRVRRLQQGVALLVERAGRKRGR